MSAAASPDDTVSVTGRPAICAATGNGWSIDNAGVAEQTTDSPGMLTAIIDADTADVVAIAAVGSVFGQVNAQGLLRAKAGGPGCDGAWTSRGSNRTPASPLRPIASETANTAGNLLRKKRHVNDSFA